MIEVLASPKAFKSMYVKNPVIYKAVISCILGIGASSAVIGAAAASAGSAAGAVAATTGLAGFVGHFAAWPLIGGAASSYVSAVAGGATAMAAGSAAIAALPVSLAAGGVITGATMILIRKKTAPYQKGTGLEQLAQTVGGIIFLPLLAKYKKMIEEDSSLKTKAFDAAVERITEFGYKKGYADNLVTKALEQYTADELSKMFDSILTKLNELKKNGRFEGIPKFELPPKGIQKLAFQISNS